MPSKLLRGMGCLAYALLVFVIFGLAAYTSFSVFVRSGATTVPSVEGMSQTDAANVLADQGLRAVEGTGRYDDKVPAGLVARQSPDAKSFVKRGSPVNVVLSLGPRRVAVPDLRGKTLPGAQGGLSGTGLALGRILGALAPHREGPGSVIEQDPDPNAAVPPATGVDLLLAMAVPGERYVMPDLVYRNYDQVRPYFEQRGFKLGNVKFERYEGVAAGVILRQFPLPGHPVSREDAISLVVATADGALMRLAPSLLAADLADLAGALALCEKGGADLLHFDVMDGHFVPNLSFGIPVLKAVRARTRLPIDVHLMVANPDRLLDDYLAAGASRLIVHWEAATHLDRLLERIRKGGAEAGVAVNPATPVELFADALQRLDFVLLMSVNPGFGGQAFLPHVLDKARRLRRMIEISGLRVEIEMDGGIDRDNIGRVVSAGVDVCVAGSAIFGAGDPQAIMSEMSELRARARPETV